jgi:hypothetical protein
VPERRIARVMPRHRPKPAGVFNRSFFRPWHPAMVAENRGRYSLRSSWSRWIPGGWRHPPRDAPPERGVLAIWQTRAPATSA